MPSPVPVLSSGVAVSATWLATGVAALSWPPSYSRKIGSRLAWVASISCLRPRTGPGMTSSCGSTTRAPGRGEPHRADQAALQHPVAPAGGRDQPLLVHVQGGLVPGDQDAVALPVGQQAGGVVVLLARPAGSWRGGSAGPRCADPHPAIAGRCPGR